MKYFLIFISLLIIGKVSGKPAQDPEFPEDCSEDCLAKAQQKRVICCYKKTGTKAPPRVPNDQRISVKKCEEYKNLMFDELPPFTLQSKIKIVGCSSRRARIVGGQTTKTGEFSHMAAIGYGDFNEIMFACGGSLISEKFVLTAAHCLGRKSNPPVLVRLGDQNLKSEDDGAQSQEFRVKRLIKHENYSRKANYDNIGLIELDGEVRFTKFVRPACLWQEMQIPSKTAIATGWGLLEYAGSPSDELQKLSLTLMQNRDCQLYFTEFIKNSEKLKRGIVDGHLCAGAIVAGTLAGGKDTCQGDSGGPLQITLEDNPCVHYVVGLTSFTGAGCGIENSPGIYTRVSEYIDWIESKVWP
jgi:transmembrane serine protease 3